jgi:hypothetical protein
MNELLTGYIGDIEGDVQMLPVRLVQLCIRHDPAVLVRLPILADPMVFV